MLPIQARAFPSHLKTQRPVATALLIAGLAQAVTITVPCSGSGGGASGLVAAINTANSTSGANTIKLTPGCVYTVTTTNDPTGGQNGLPPIAGILTIDGYGATVERSQAAGTPEFRIFGVPLGGNLTLNTITIKRGVANNNEPGAPCEGDPIFVFPDEGLGGGVCNAGTLTLNYSTVIENATLNVAYTPGYDPGGRDLQLREGHVEP